VKRFFLELLTIVFLLVLCAHSQTQSPPAPTQSAAPYRTGTSDVSGAAAIVPLCQILARPDNYLGRLVNVKVRVRAYRHGTSISDSSCPQKALTVIANDAAVKDNGVLGFFRFLAQHRNSTAPIYAKLTGRTVRGTDEGFVLKREFVFKLEAVSEFAEAHQ
jgi:hypothetical protein